MQITTTIGPVTVLAVTGDIDADTFPQLIREADTRLAAGQVRLVLDLSDVDYISSGGLVALQTIAGRAAARGGKAVLCGLNPRVMKVLEIAGFTQLLSIVPDRAVAMAEFRE